MTMTTNAYDNQELFKTTVDDVETWCACLTVAGQTYRRTLGAVADMSEAQASEALEDMRKAATPTVTIQDVTFGELAMDWQKNIVDKKLAKNRREWTASLLRRYILPTWGHRLVRSIVSPELLIYYLSLKETTPRGIASECRQTMSQIFKYGIASSRAERDPAGELKRYVSRPTAIPRPAILEPEKIGQLMRDIDQVPVLETRLRILLQAYTFTRSGECRLATWPEIDLKRKTWTIPSRRMKMRREHIVPLSPQVVAILRQLKREYGSTKWLFPSLMRHKKGRPMCATTPLYALQALGYDTQRVMCLHGFRAMACSTLSKSKLFSDEAAELQLAHAENDSTRVAYHRSDFWEERVEIMRWWSDWLDSVKSNKSQKEAK